MDHLFTFKNRFVNQRRIIAGQKKRNIVPPVPKRSVFVNRPAHTFRQGLIGRLANPAGCACGK